MCILNINIYTENIISNNKLKNNRITYDANVFKSLLPSKGKILGLDTGNKKIGVSISNYSQRLSLHFGLIKRSKFIIDLKILDLMVKDNDIKGLIIGLPLNLEGKMGPRAQSVLTFSINIDKILKIPILLWDERYSSIAVEKQMIKHDLTRKKRKKSIDSSAAIWILQGALDRLETIENNT